MNDHSSLSNTTEAWSQYAKRYDPIKIGSIDGTDNEPHDKGIIRAINSDYRPNRHVKGNPECTIFVARLSPRTTKDTIKEVFSKFGRLRRFRLVKDIVTGFPKGYAFIEYESERAAEEAYKKANKMYIDGQSIFVDFECERLLKGWKPRRLGGGFAGRKESGQLRFGGRDRPFRKPITMEIHERQQMTKECREREYRREGHRRHKYRDSEDREQRHKHLDERYEDDDYRHNREHHDYSRKRHRSYEHNEYSRDLSEHREERNHKEKINVELSENNIDHDKISKGTGHNSYNRNEN